MKSLLWVEDSLIKELQLLDEVEEISQDQIKKVAARLTNEIEMLSDNIDSNVLSIRTKAQQVKEMYQKTVDEECEAIDLLWEKLDGVRYDAKKKLTQTITELQSIKAEVKMVNDMIDKIYQSDYKLQRTLDIFERFNKMSAAEKEMLSKLLSM